MLVPLTNDLIHETLTSSGLRYFAAESGAALVIFGPNDDCPRVQFIIAADRCVLACEVDVHASVQHVPFEHLLLFANAWNTHHRWPQVGVELTPAGVSTLVAYVNTAFPVGLTSGQLDAAIENLFASGTSLGKSVDMFVQAGGCTLNEEDLLKLLEDELA